MSSHRQPILNETRIRVRYAETDQMGVVYHANHLIWFEVGRVELMGMGDRQWTMGNGPNLAPSDDRKTSKLQCGDEDVPAPGMTRCCTCDVVCCFRSHILVG